MEPSLPPDRGEHRGAPHVAKETKQHLANAVVRGINYGAGDPGEIIEGRQVVGGRAGPLGRNRSRRRTEKTRDNGVKGQANVAEARVEAGQLDEAALIERNVLLVLPSVPEPGLVGRFQVLAQLAQRVELSQWWGE